MSSEDWHATIKITETMVKNCMTQFSELLPIQSIVCMGEGWDNKVYLINQHYIFRFPRREIAIILIERENIILKQLQHLVSLNIPNPTFIGQASLAYPYPFQGYSMIPGQAGYEANLSLQERIASIEPLSYFLKQLHAIDEEKAREFGAQPQLSDRTDVIKFCADLTGRVQKIVDREIFAINLIEFQKEIAAALLISLPRTEKCLVHGDLYARHLMFEQGILTGIIDWGDVGINNRAVDLAVIWSFYPSSCHAKFFAIYGQVDKPTWEYARFLGLYGSFMVLLYAQDINDQLLMQEALTAINGINPLLF